MPLDQIRFDQVPATERAAGILASYWLPSSGSAESRMQISAAVRVLQNTISDVMVMPEQCRTMAVVRDLIDFISRSPNRRLADDAVATALLNLTDGRAEWMSRNWPAVIARARREGRL